MPGGNLAPANLDSAGSCAGHVLACTFDFTAGISEHTVLLLHYIYSSMSCLQARAAPKKAAPAPKAAAFAPAKPPVSAAAAAVPKCVACSPYTYLATIRIVANSQWLINDIGHVSYQHNLLCSGLQSCSIACNHCACKCLQCLCATSYADTEHVVLAIGRHQLQRGRAARRRRQRASAHCSRQAQAARCSFPPDLAFIPCGMACRCTF